MSTGKWDSILVGNLGRDPELSTTQSGTKVCKFSIAINRKRKGEEYLNWVNIVAFDKLGELAAQYLRKGSKVLVDGQTEIRKYTGRDGIDKQSTDVVARDILFLDSKDSSAQQPAPIEAPVGPVGETTDEDVPF